MDVPPADETIQKGDRNGSGLLALPLPFAPRNSTNEDENQFLLSSPFTGRNSELFLLDWIRGLELQVDRPEGNHG